MEYTVACNWDPALVDKLDFPEVRSLFGGIPDTIISGGRPSIVINKITDADIKEYIKRVHSRGWKFDFNINSTCLGNMEITAEGFKKIIAYLERISDFGVDSVTIAHTNLIEIVKKNFPKLKVKVSTYQKVNSVSFAQRFEDLGVDAIMLSEHVNRNIKLLKEIRRNVKCKLVLLANVGCIYNCLNMHTHANCTAHSGAFGEKTTIFSETFHTYCLQKRIQDPIEFIKMRWIRPEDVAYYEEIGIDMLKIIERSSSTETLVERMKAYHDRSYDGNLLNLPGQMMDRKHTDQKVNTSIKSSMTGQNAEKGMRLLASFPNSLSDLYYLDNKKIPADFIEGFATKNCDLFSCGHCDYCGKIGALAMTTKDSDVSAMYLKKLRATREEIMNGTALY
jgi:collagenase-like PrtC family protease